MRRRINSRSADTPGKDAQGGHTAANRAKGISTGLLLLLIAIMAGIFYHADRSAVGTEAEDTQAFVPKGAAEEPRVVLNGTVYRYTDEIESLLILGTDQSGENASGDGAYQGDMADMLLVVVIDHTTQEYAVLQLNRDTITNVHLLNTADEAVESLDLQLCTAHWYGSSDAVSCENTVRSVSELLGGIPIDTYYCLSWEGIPTLNSVVDGVTLTIQNDFSAVDPSLVQGETVTLTDEQAATFLRSRYGVDEGDNIGRMERHRQYLTAWMQKVREKSSEDSGFAASAYRSLSPYVCTNLTGSQISSVAQQVLGYSSLGIYTFDGELTTGSRLGDGIVHMEFFTDDESRLDILSTLYHLEETGEDPEKYEQSSDNGSDAGSSEDTETTDGRFWIDGVEYEIND
jgi:anionic cell wall polymer biosynthesis LytR-Cps2A-Psr (LCP) family protein